MPRKKKTDETKVRRRAQKERKTLFDKVPHVWEKEWWGMPEFVMQNAQPQRQIIISFMTKEDVEEFAEMTGLQITDRTRSVWFPKKENLDSPKQWRYVTKESEKNYDS